MARHLAPLGARFLNRAEPCDLRILVGYYFHNGEDLQRREIETAKKSVIWWVGTDIKWLMENRSGERSAWLKRTPTEHWAEWPLSKQRLGFAGLNQVRVVPMPTRNRFQPMPLPPRFTVGCYCYASRDHFYGGELIRQAARLTPEISWFMYPRSGPSGISNLEYVKRVDPDAMGELYRRMSVHVRIVEADGMPQGPMEAAMAGRPVIYNFAPMPHVELLKLQNPKNLVNQLRRIRAAQERGEGYNLEGSQYWREFNDPEKLIGQVQRIMRRR